MDINDINDAIERGHIRDIEEAFKALIDYPNYDLIDGARQSDLGPLMRRVCAALQDDTSILPQETAILVTDLVDDASPIADYATAAQTVLAHWESWATRL